jgi:prepilin-type N-terminal cleavage/methylation domain-containing protein
MMTTPTLLRFAESRQSAPLAGWRTEELKLPVLSRSAWLCAVYDEVGWFLKWIRSARRATKTHSERCLKAPGCEVETMKFATNADRLRGFTLIEVMVALAISGLLFSGIISAYIQTSRQAEWSGYSLAAQAIGIQQIEQARSGVWDFSISKNELTNLNLRSWSYNATTKVGTGYTTNVLDLPISGTNIVMATNFVTVRMLGLTGLANVQVQMVTVDTVWPFPTRHGTRLFTNRTASYFGPDNRDASSL